MEDLYEFGKFFPYSTTDEVLNNYVEHHIGSLYKCVENELFSSAYSHLHLLYMAFIYIQLLRIAREKKKEFEYGWIGFPSQEQDFLKNPTSPFSFAPVNEKSVFRFFRLVGFNDADIGNIASLIKVRNNRMHASGNLHCSTIEEFDKELAEYIQRMKLVVKNQHKFLEEIYTGLLSTYDDEYKFTQDDLENNFTDQYLFSEYELKHMASNRHDKISVFINESI